MEIETIVVCLLFVIAFTCVTVMIDEWRNNK